MNPNLPVSQTAQSNPNPPVVNNPDPAPQKKSKLFLVIILILLLIVVGAIFYYFLVLNKTTSNVPEKNQAISPTQIPQNLLNKQIYNDENWGFEALYPKSWFTWKSGTGDTIYFASYDGKEKNAWYSPNSSELRIALNIMPNDETKESQSANNEVIQEQEGPTIGGEKSTETLTKRPFSAYEVNRYQTNKIPQTQIDKGRSIISYKVLHDDFTYAIYAEPSDSTLSASLKDFLNDFKFINRKTYQGRLGLMPAGITFYQNLRLGFTFDYPDDLLFNMANDLGTFTLKNTEETSSSDSGYLKANVKLIDNTYKQSDNFEKDMMKYASLSCAADGPGSSISCPEGSVYISTFTNKFNTKGYMIKRKKVASLAGNKTTTDEVLYVFKLDALDYFAIMFSTDNPKDKETTLNLADTFQYLDLKK